MLTFIAFTMAEIEKIIIDILENVFKCFAFWTNLQVVLLLLRVLHFLSHQVPLVNLLNLWVQQHRENPVKQLTLRDGGFLSFRKIVHTYRATG